MGDENVRDSGALGHISDSELSGFLDDDLDPTDRRRVEAHLDACAQCRRELIEVRSLAASYRPPATLTSGRLWARIAAGAALAAVLAAVVLLPRSNPTVPGRTDAVRTPTQAGSREGRLRIDAVSPASDAAVAASAVVFAWHSTAADIYRLTLLTESGEPVWSLETADTSAVVPSSTPLKPGAYFWRVDAIGDGITATTGVRRLIVAR